MGPLMNMIGGNWSNPSIRFLKDQGLRRFCQAGYLQQLRRPRMTHFLDLLSGTMSTMPSRRLSLSTTK
jgi:hypothetical protein